MDYRKFIINLIIIYLLVSLPDMLGFGYVVIDWVPEATLFKKITGYFYYGLIENVFLKCMIVLVVGLGSLVLYKYRKSS